MTGVSRDHHNPCNRRGRRLRVPWIQQWLDVLLAMGSCSGLVTATESSRHVVDHRLRVISKFAPIDTAVLLSYLGSDGRILQRS